MQRRTIARVEAAAAGVVVAETSQSLGLGRQQQRATDVAVESAEEMLPIAEQVRQVEDAEGAFEALEDTGRGLGDVEAADLQELEHLALAAELLARIENDVEAAARRFAQGVGESLHGLVHRVRGVEAVTEAQGDLGLLARRAGQRAQRENRGDGEDARRAPCREPASTSLRCRHRGLSGECRWWLRREPSRRRRASPWPSHPARSA